MTEIPPREDKVHVVLLKYITRQKKGLTLTSAPYKLRLSRAVRGHPLPAPYMSMDMINQCHSEHCPSKKSFSLVSHILSITNAAEVYTLKLQPKILSRREPQPSLRPPCSHHTGLT